MREIISFGISFCRIQYPYVVRTCDHGFRWRTYVDSSKMKILGASFCAIVIVHEIQPREDSMGSGTDGMTYISDRNPHLFGVNRNDDGRRVNAYNDHGDNAWNRENGFAFLAPQLFSFLLDYDVGEFCFAICPPHPPSIFPASLSGVESAIYFFVSSACISHAI